MLSRWNILRNPWVDKMFAILAISPFLYRIWALTFHQDWRRNLPIDAYVIYALIMVVSMLYRRTATRITTRPLFFVVTYIGSYWSLLSVWVPTGPSLTPLWLSNGLMVPGVLFSVWARISLGRNMGVLPAQRGIAERGAFRYLRHPNYSAAVFFISCGALQNASALNLLYSGLGIFWFLWKSLIEEEFMALDPLYLEYMDRVRWRWVPGLL